MSPQRSALLASCSSSQLSTVSKVGFGERAKRFALIIDDLKVTYVGIEDAGAGGVGPSGVEAVLAKL